MNKTANIVLTGFMGTGKTVIGREIARRTGREFFDTDAVIEQQNKRSVAEIFADEGETFFRQQEKDVLNRLGQKFNSVIATGGGSLLTLENIAEVESTGVIFCLEARLEVLLARLREGDSRPLLRGKGLRPTLEQLLLRRSPAYQRLPNHLDTSDLSVTDAATKIINRFNEIVDV